MFHVEHVVPDNKVPTIIEDIDYAYGISNDYLLIPKGPLKLKLNGIWQQYPAHTAFFLPKWTPYSYSTCDESYSDAFIHFKKDDCFLNNHLIPYSKPIALNDPYSVYLLIELIAIENISDDDNRNDIIDKLMKALFMKISESVNQEINIPYYTEISALRREALQNPESKYTNDYISERLHISPSYFHTLYKSAFNTTFIQDIINARIERSKHYLAFSNQSVSQIAESCGYNNLEHFSRQFKKVTGKSPLQYRHEKLQ